MIIARIMGGKVVPKDGVIDKDEQGCPRLLGLAHAIFHPKLHRKCNPELAEYFGGLFHGYRDRAYRRSIISLALWCPPCALLGLWLFICGKAVRI